VDRAPAIDEKDAVAVDVVELEILIVIDEEETSLARHLQPRHIRFSQRHAGLEATDVAVMLQTRVRGHPITHAEC
jgi:hypothetical protein